MKKLFVLLIFTALLYSCKNGKNESKPGANDTGYVDISEIPDSLKQRPVIDSTAIVVVNKDSVLRKITKDIFTLIKTKNYSALDSFIHPERGVRFSPYANISSSDKKFSSAEFVSLFTKNKNKKYDWGNYDGSGDPIVLTAAEYFKKFVYDANFLHPEKFTVNKIIGTGNSLNNIHSFYKSDDFTESYFSGSKKADGMDWKTVRLVFAQKDGKYYLIGIVHDQWTI